MAMELSWSEPCLGFASHRFELLAPFGAPVFGFPHLMADCEALRKNPDSNLGESETAGWRICRFICCLFECKTLRINA